MSGAPTQYSLLIVDDNRVNLRILQATFEDEGFRVTTASKVEDAQTVLQGNGGTIDLVLSDIQMPGLTGFDLVRWMKEHEGGISEIPILLITSQLPEPENRILGLSLGAIDYLSRSLDPKELVIKAMHAIESYKRICNLKSNLENTENLAATGRLLAASNHEVKNLAQIIKVAVSMLSRASDTPSQKEQDRVLAVLKESTDLLVDLTRSMGGLVSSRPTAAKPVDLLAAINSVVSMMQPILRTCPLKLQEASEERLWVLANDTSLKQVVINLLLNARDAIAEAGKTSEAQIELAFMETEHDTVLLRIKDNGAGLSAPETRCDFLPFSSTKHLRGGSGLGLWLSSRLLRDLGGSLKLSSEGPGRGAVAEIELRKSQQPVSPSFDVSQYFTDNDVLS